MYKVEDLFIKLSSDKDFIEGRINRAKNLEGLCPPLLYEGKNLYSYKWIKGRTLYNCDDPRVWEDFLCFAKKYMWKPAPRNVDNILFTVQYFQNLCSKFYKNKTLERLRLFLSNRDESYKNAHVINGTPCPPIEELIDNLDMDKLYQGLPTKVFHGDLQFDNIIYGNDKKFYLIDWRHDFAGGDIGDVYYDLAKMYGGILMSYSSMKDRDRVDPWSCSCSGTEASFEHARSPSLEKFEKFYENWVVSNDFSFDKVKTLAALIFLNMAPLHEKEFGDLCFFKSKLMLSP